jgi:hypothetical protein
MVFPLWFPSPALIASDPCSHFCFDAFSAQISLRNLRELDCYANRYPLRAKTLWSCFQAGHALFWGSIVNAAADGKRLRAIDALR